MQQIKVVIASVLKPLKDPRSYDKFAVSLRETNKYQINIIGFSRKKETIEKNIKFHPIFCRNKNHFSRIWAPFQFLGLIIKIQPKILIVTTFELLPFAVLGKLFLGCRLVYDVQENYILNISRNKTIKGWKIKLAKSLVQIIEYCSNPFIDHFFFAEKCYPMEMPNKNPFTVLENKFQGNSKNHIAIDLQSKKNFRFLISGTLTEVYGIMKGIQWFKQILLSYPQSILQVIGYCPMSSYSQKLKESVADLNSIQLEISDFPIDHSEIMKAYDSADIILLPYHQIPSISPKIPSKLYESLALRKLILYSPNTLWEELIGRYPAGIPIDFTNLDQVRSNFDSFLGQRYYEQSPGDEVLWKSQEKEFLKAIESLEID